MGQTPGVDQRFPALGGVFDDVDHIAQIDHIGWGVGNIGLKVRIPAGTGETQAVDVFDVGPVAAAVVEVGGVGGEETGFDSEADGFGGGNAGDRSLVPLNLRLGLLGRLDWTSQGVVVDFDALLGEAAFPVELGANLAGVIEQAHGDLLLG